MPSLDLILEVSTCDYDLEIGSSSYDFDIGEAVEIVEPPQNPYTGPYDITPNLEDQVLETGSKWMADNVTVHPIPYYETTNPSGGYTVIIG